MKKRRTLLNSLLRTLVDEWGRDEVAAALASTNDPSIATGANHVLDRKHRSYRDHIRPSATDQVKQVAVDLEAKQVLLQLADRYDHRKFLPSVADVREFLIMMDERPLNIKDRKDAFRVLLRSLIQLPIERLEQLNHTAQHSGPSELGPLSDAISSAGRRLPRQRFADGDIPARVEEIAAEMHPENAEPSLPK